MTKYRFSFQLYSARNFPPVERQLKGLAEIGFDGVEPFGPLYESDPAAFRVMADSVGLKIPTAHMPLALIDGDRSRAIAIAKTLGLETLVLPYLVPDARPTDVAGWKALAERIGGHVAALAKEGLRVAWHNHDFEYAKLADGSRPIDHFAAVADLLFEPDIGWIERAGQSVTAEIAKFGRKVAAFHVKDISSGDTKVEDGWADVGSGRIDWKTLWPTMAASGADLLVLEHDNPTDWRRFAANSHRFLTALASGRGG
jgi:sugar phosphate isomerase/epimerase